MYFVSIIRNGSREYTSGETLYPHDSIELSSQSQARIKEKCAHLYEEGYSLRGIQEQTGISKTALRDIISESGVPLRNALVVKKSKNKNQQNSKGGNTPYGWTYLDGKLVIDPREQVILRKILKLNQQESSNQAIADELNSKGHTTRKNGEWNRNVIREIIIRNKEIKKGN